MIDARQASAALGLPYYWFSDSSLRNQHRIPHYLLGGLVRYRLSELSAWVAARAALQRGEASNAQAGEEQG